MSRRNDSGIIMIFVLWLLVILSMLTIGIARRTSVELTLTKHGIGRLKSKYCAIGGVVYAIDRIIHDSKSQRTSNKDSLYECGVDLDKKEAQEIFANIPMGEGRFDISYKGEERPAEIHYGLRDEEARINLNALTDGPEVYRVLQQLIMVFGHDEDTARTVAASVVDWRDENDDVFDRPYGAEDEYYETLPEPYPCKNRSFDSVSELLLVKGMTAAIFNDIKDYVTVFPQSGSFRVNLDTASEPVLKALARSWTGPKTNTDISQADSLAEKIVSYRRGPDDIDGTEDDPEVDAQEAGLTAPELILALLAENYRTRKSEYLRMEVTGTDDNSSVTTHISAVVKRSNLAIVEWHRE